MPSLETSDLLQTAVLWKWLRTDKHGQPVVDSPQEVDCRWVWKRRIGFDAEGQPVALDATVALDCDIPDGSVLWLGCLNNFTDDGTNRIMAIVTIGGTPDVKARETRYEYGLKRYGSKLPTLG